MKLSIQGKLIAAFGIILCLMLFIVGFNFYSLESIDQSQKRLVEQRVATVIAGKDIRNDINLSLAALRGYIILGDNPAKAEAMKSQRAHAFEDIDKKLEVLEQMSAHWTDPTNVERLASLQQILAEFKIAQQSVEDIAWDKSNIEAFVILLDQAAPLATEIIAELTKLIEMEAQLSATPERKNLLKLLADTRGSFALSLANIRAFLLSGDQKFLDKFNATWATNSERLSQVENLSSLFNSAQSKHWQDYRAHRVAFDPLPPLMFEKRSADDWNKANYILAREAAPRAKEAIEILTAMSASQVELMHQDTHYMHATVVEGEISNAIGAAIALILSIVIGLALSRNIMNRLSVMKARAEEISNNQF
ncbi:MAG: MCP four helix bundle domain-containing protein, partial [Pseudomonadales bacterium]